MEDRSAPISRFSLKRCCKPSESAQRETQRLIRFGHDRRLQLAVPGPALPSRERQIIYRQCRRSLDAGFHVLLLGLGSKHDLVQDLARTVLTQYACVTIDGYSNLFSIRYLLTAIGERVLHVQLRRRHPDLLVQDLVAAFERRASTHLYLVVHSLDGPRFRNAKMQNVFSRLAQCRYIHIVATADHIRTRLLWDSAAASSFAFHTIQAHTLQTYLHETANPMLNQRKGKRSKAAANLAVDQSQSSSAIAAIWACLTSRQREALSNLAFSQVNRDNSGLSFREWMDLSNATSDRDFRRLIDELRFHKIVDEIEDPDTSAIRYKIPYSDDIIKSRLLHDDDPF